jgi:hypothetical protein
VHQKIQCGNCNRVVMETFNARIDEGWSLPCRCGHETRISKAKATTETRCDEGLRPDPPSHRPSNEELSQGARTAPASALVRP